MAEALSIIQGFKKSLSLRGKNPPRPGGNNTHFKKAKCITTLTGRDHKIITPTQLVDGYFRVKDTLGILTMDLPLVKNIMRKPIPNKLNTKFEFAVMNHSIHYPVIVAPGEGFISDVYVVEPKELSIFVCSLVYTHKGSEKIYMSKIGPDWFERKHKVSFPK
jgi:hypothetical protein